MNAQTDRNEGHPPVRDLELKKGLSVRELVERMEGMAFNAGQLGKAAEIWVEAAKPTRIEQSKWTEITTSYGNMGEATVFLAVV